VGQAANAVEKVGKQMWMAAANNAISQGVNIAFGLQEKFNWASVAASAVAAPTAAKVGGKVDAAMGARGAGQFATKLVGGLARGAVSQATYAAFTGGRINYAQLIADSFGNALGAGIVDAMETAGLPAEVRAMDAESQAAYRHWKRELRRGGASRDDARDLATRVVHDMHRPGSNDERLALLNDLLRSTGATAADLAPIQEERGLGFEGAFAATNEHYAMTKLAYEPLFADNSGQVYDATELQETSFGRVVKAAAPVLEPIGQGLMRLSETIGSNKYARWGLMAIDFAAGPVKFLVSQAIQLSPLGKLLNDATEFLFNETTSFIAEQTGFTQERAANIAVGAVGLTYMVVGAAVLIRNLPTMARALNSRMSWSRRIDELNRRDYEVALRNGVDPLSVRDANALPGPHRGTLWVREPQGNINSRSNQWESGASNARSDVATGDRAVPALRYDHANPSPHTSNFVKFDGFDTDPDGTLVLIDRKWTLRDQERSWAAMERASSAIRQNTRDGVRVVYEVPDQRALLNAQRILAEQNITNIDVRIGR
jgi:hypothetical protein